MLWARAASIWRAASDLYSSYRTSYYARMA